MIIADCAKIIHLHVLGSIIWCVWHCMIPFIAGDYCCGKILEEAETTFQPSSINEADQIREEDEQERREIELSDKCKEYIDEMEVVEKEAELHLHELHEEDEEKMEVYADKLEEEEGKEVLVDTVSDEQAQEERQPVAMKWLKKPAMANLLATEISDQQVYSFYSSVNVLGVI